MVRAAGHAGIPNDSTRAEKFLSLARKVDVRVARAFAARGFPPGDCRRIARDRSVSGIDAVNDTRAEIGGIVEER